MPSHNGVNYFIKVSRRARHMRLSVCPVRKPSSPEQLNLIAAESFSSCEAGDSAVMLTLPFGVSLGVAEKFVQSKIAWIKRAVEYFRIHPGLVRIKPVRGEYKKYKKQAQILAYAKVKEWSEFYGVKYGRISVRNQKTRWGSCSKKGNLNFNFRIVHLRPELLDYLIVHELCHLQEFNHSRKFWALVAKAVPAYKPLRAELKKFVY